MRNPNNRSGGARSGDLDDLDCAQQRGHQRTLAVKQVLCSQCEQSSYYVDAGSRFLFSPARKLTGPENSINAAH